MGAAPTATALTLAALTGTHYMVRAYSPNKVALWNHTETTANHQFEASHTTEPLDGARRCVVSNSLVGGWGVSGSGSW